MTTTTTKITFLLVLGLSVAACGITTCGLASAQRKPASQRVASPWDIEAREYLGTREGEQAVDRGLQFLASRQLPDGHWASGQYGSEVAVTGLSLLAFLSAGNQPGRGKYGLLMNQAVDYLTNNVRMDGRFQSPPGLVRADPSRGAGPPMYGHGFATLALAEVYGMTRQKELKPKLEAAVKLIEDTQNLDGNPVHDGGWRYQPGQQDADISVTVVQVLALRAARNAGIRVLQPTIDRAIHYMESCANNPDGGFSYQVSIHQSGPARTGAGCLSLMMAGKRDSDICRRGLNYLSERPYQAPYEYAYREHFFYALYYVTQAMYQAGGTYWKRWYPPIRDFLVRNQNASDGDWGARGYSEAGSEYATAMAILVLQAPAGLLPIYQKL